MLRMPPRLCRLRQAFAVSILSFADSSGYCLRLKIVDSRTEALVPRPSEALWEKIVLVGSPRPLAGKLPAVAAFWLVFFLIR